MKRDGMNMLDFCVPALVEGQLSYLCGTRYLGQLVAICFVPPVGLIPAECLDRQAGRFQEIDTVLLIVSPRGWPLHRLWSPHSVKPRTPVLADPCGRLHRSFGVAATEPSPCCHTFLVQREGTFRLALTHDFSESGLENLRQIVVRSRLQAAGTVINQERSRHIERDGTCKPGLGLRHVSEAMG